MAPHAHALYWSCAGDVLALGGPLPGPAGGGCRSLDLDAARRLRRFYLREAGLQASASAAAFCRRCAQELAAAIDGAERWRRAAGWRHHCPGPGVDAGP